VRIETIAYRGEHGEPDEPGKFHTRTQALSFGSAKSARTYANSPNDMRDKVKSPRVIKARLTMENPFINQPADPFVEFSDIRRALGHERAMELARDLEDSLTNTDNFLELLDEHNCTRLEELNEIIGPSIVDKLYVDAYLVLDRADVIQELIDAGYDGAIHCGNGETALEAEYKVFDHSQAEIIWSKDLRRQNEVELGPSP